MQDAADQFGADVETDAYENVVVSSPGSATRSRGPRRVPRGPRRGPESATSSPTDFSVGVGSVDPLKDERIEGVDGYVEDLDTSALEFQQHGAA